MHASTEDYFLSLKCILCYVKGIIHRGFQLHRTLFVPYLLILMLIRWVVLIYVGLTLAILYS